MSQPAGPVQGDGAVTLPPLEPLAAPARWWQRGPRSNPLSTAIRWALLLAFAVIFLYPFLWSVSSALKTRNDFFVHNTRLIPPHFEWSNFVHIFTGVPDIAAGVPFGHWFLNSMYIGVLAAGTVTISSALVAFAFAYFQFPLRNALFACVLGSMMLPSAVTMIATYLIWNKVHLTGTQYPLWLSNVFGSAFYIFLLRQFFLGIPRELFEAARMDGDNYWTMFWRIAFPLARPALIVTFVFEFKASWTDLMKPLIYLNHDSQFTIPRGLFNLIGTLGPNAGGHGDYEIVMAGLVLATLPMIVIFFFGQRYFMEGIATQGRKG
ncbi:MAG TPA: carbohydrate ABC transporter permease [Gaiellaceae bacterium]|jgi:multiple sugar transport system permease protein|nr:carbohydrate ABC transporter permease [Gaiellaceae bacterium]